MGKPRDKFDLVPPIYKLREFKKFPDEKEIHFWEPGVELFKQAPGVDVDAYLKENDKPPFSKLTEDEKDKLIPKICQLPQAQGFGMFILIKSDHLAEEYLIPAYNKNDKKPRINFQLTLQDKKIENFSVEGGPWGNNQAGITHTSIVDLCSQHGIISLDSKYIAKGYFLGFGLIKTTKGFIFLNRSANMQIPSIAWDPFYAEVQGGFLRTGSNNPLRFAPREISLIASRVAAKALQIPLEDVIDPRHNYESEFKFSGMSKDDKIHFLKLNFVHCFKSRNSVGQIDLTHLCRINKIAQDNHVKFQWSKDDYRDIYKGLFSGEFYGIKKIFPESAKELTPNYSEVLEQLILAGLNDHIYTMIVFDETHPLEQVLILKNKLETLQEKFQESYMLSEKTFKAELKQLQSGVPIHHLKKLVYIIGIAIKNAAPHAQQKIIDLLAPLAKPLSVDKIIMEYINTQYLFLEEVKKYKNKTNSDSKKIISFIESTSVDFNVAQEPLLILAIRRDDKELINALLEQKIDVNIKEFSITALSTAATKGDLETVIKLLDHGADMLDELEDASAANHADVLKVLLNRYTLPPKHPDRINMITSAAQKAIRNNSTDCLSILLETQEIDFSKITNYGFQERVRHLLLPHLIFEYPYPSFGEKLTEKKLTVENRLLIDEIHMLSNKYQLKFSEENNQKNMDDFKEQVEKIIACSPISVSDKLKYKSKVNGICAQLKVRSIDPVSSLTKELYHSDLYGRRSHDFKPRINELLYFSSLYAMYDFQDPIRDARDQIRKLNEKLPLDLQLDSEKLKIVTQRANLSDLNKVIQQMQQVIAMNPGLNIRTTRRG